MKALVYTGPETLAYQEVADPEPQTGEQLIKIDSVGICGSDMHAYLGHDDRRPAPLILGHEVAGVIQGGPRDGTRVTVNPLVSCDVCPACKAGRDNLCPHRQIVSMPPREGAFAESIAMRDQNLVIVPDDVPLTKAALAEPIACGWHAVRLGHAALTDPIETALAFGGGAIGVGAALSALAQGVPSVTIVEPNESRRQTVEAKLGLRAVTSEMLETEPDYDLIVDGVGYEATRRAASAKARPGGAILHIGLGSAEGGLDIRRMTLQEIAFIGTYTYTAADFRDTASAIFDGRLGTLDWIEERDLRDGAHAFQDIRNGSAPMPKVILTP